ncbi:MAG TPA: N-acetylmuramoyl-L-alanine amidase [Nitrospirota bacterium]|nr:N-acetylmuramoyl-L-alanine amidase [Nitrospirota bacterium]
MRILTLFISLVLLASSTGLGAEKGLVVKGVRYSSYPAFTRIVFEVEAAAPYVLTRSQDSRSIMLGSYEGTLVLKTPLPQIHDAAVAGLEPWEEGGRTYAVIRLDAPAGSFKDFTLRGPDRIVIDISRSGTASPPPRTEQNVLVVLDPGHGGKDSGLIAGPGTEKSVDLELAQAVRKILRKADRFRVLLTREKDQSLSLDERAAAANAAGAAVFVGIHASAGADARVYIQDLVDESGSVAVQTTRPAGSDFIGFESESAQQKQLWGKQQAPHAQQSGALGRVIIRKITAQENAEPVQAPLAELAAVDAAAVIVEIGMEFDRVRAAEAIAGGIEQYVGTNR